MRRLVPLWLPLAAACGGFDSSVPPEGVRVVTGRLAPPDPALFARRQVALQFAAASIDAREASPIVDLRVGPPFNPAGNGGLPVTFRLALPADGTYVLFFQVPVDNGQRLGQLAARIKFAENGAGELGALVPGRLADNRAITDLDLGVVEIVSARTSDGGELPASHVATLGTGGSNNPLSQNDVDGDGVPDVEDADDDDDLIPDEGDTDAHADDVPDDQQTLEALADADGDDVPDVFESR